MKNKQIEELLKNAVEQDRIVNGYMFSGIRKNSKL